ncbi:hypothetical protein [Schlesneria paludicola]|uniref:hypothetical protein n=1 Tax=Schlesneria paludicola TaxID=360056 RepID=UPI00029B5500|nr:hypothetical protein [Schlesneria paludicola]
MALSGFPYRVRRVIQGAIVKSIAQVALVCGLFASAYPGSVGSAAEGSAMVDLTQAVVVAPDDLSPREKKAVMMLVEEVRKRSMVHWTRVSAIPKSVDGPLIVVGPQAKVRSLLAGKGIAAPAAAETTRPEGYQIAMTAKGAIVAVLGNDERGVLFGVGRLLRELRLTRGKAELPAGFNEVSAPESSLRGHQLGYRQKTNSYDAWDLAQWEQYYRDLAVFGTNAIELIPPRSDDDADSPLFPEMPLDMMVDMSRVADEYGLDVWVWYPAMDKDYADPATVEFALREWEQVYKRLPRIDVVFVPGGDPGHTHPTPLMALLEKQAALLRKYHPKAQMWMAPQGFNKDWDDVFYEFMKTEPKWLDGIVFGPQVRTSLENVRKLIPARYPIRGYPDITHSINCQHPVPEWDVAYGVTEAREPINPRPLSTAEIFRYYQPHTIGFLTYSEGCNDDVNKFVWSGLGWNSKTPVVEILRQYGRYFIASPFAEDFAEGLLSLERNWVGPLLANGGVETTLQKFRMMELTGGPRLLWNWRFQQALYRAYYDAWLRDRLIAETAQRSAAADVLRRSVGVGVLPAKSLVALQNPTTLVSLNQAESILDQADLQVASPARRKRLDELAEALFQSTHMQLNSKLHKGEHGRGTMHDSIDFPLNDRHWLKNEFAKIRRLEKEEERRAAILAVLDRTDPGPGGFYDDLGDPNRQPHLVRSSVPFVENPDFRRSAYTSFDYKSDRPREWWTNVLSMYDASFEMQYDGLDPNARYKVRVVYSSEPARKVKVRLDAEGEQVHDYMVKPDEMQPLDFDIPAKATADGKLTIRWTREQGYGGNGRGCQVAEVWLLRKP